MLDEDPDHAAYTAGYAVELMLKARHATFLMHSGRSTSSESVNPDTAAGSMF